MSEPDVKPSDSTDNQGQTSEPTKPVPDLRAAVAERISRSGTTVREAVVSHFVQEEINKRVESVKKAVPILDVLRGEMKKHRPDQVSHDETGKVTSETWSKSALKNKQEATKKLKAFEAAFTDALENGKFEELVKQINQHSQAPQTPDANRSQSPDANKQSNHTR